MTKYNISFFELDKAAPSATIAEYGVTLNSSATKIIAEWKYAKIGYEKNKKAIIIKPHNDDADVQGSFAIKEKINNANYMRINSKDFVRVVSQYSGISLKPSIRFLVEWDDEEKLLIIDLNKILDSGKSEE